MNKSEAKVSQLDTQQHKSKTRSISAIIEGDCGELVLN